MPNLLDDRLNALAATPADAPLEGLEDVVWTKVQARKTASAAGGIGVRAALTMGALAAGLAFGVMHPQKKPDLQPHVAELGVLSEDGLLVPSVRLGGGA